MQFPYVLTVIDSSFVSLFAFVDSSTLSRASFPFSFLLCGTHFSPFCRLISCIFFIRGSATFCSGSSGFVNSIPALFSVDSFLLENSRALFICNNLLFHKLSRLEAYLLIIYYYFVSRVYTSHLFCLIYLTLGERDKKINCLYLKNIFFYLVIYFLIKEKKVFLTKQKKRMKTLYNILSLTFYIYWINAVIDCGLPEYLRP